MFKNVNRKAHRKHVEMPQDILVDVMKFEETAGDSEPEICRGRKKKLSANFFFSWRYNPHWGLYFTAL